MFGRKKKSGSDVLSKLSKEEEKVVTAIATSPEPYLISLREISIIKGIDEKKVKSVAKRYGCKIYNGIIAKQHIPRKLREDAHTIALKDWEEFKAQSNIQGGKRHGS